MSLNRLKALAVALSGTMTAMLLQTRMVSHLFQLCRPTHCFQAQFIGLMRHSLRCCSD